MLTLKLPPAEMTVSEDRGDYVFGDMPTLFLRLDWTLDKALGFFQQLNEPFSALYLSYLSTKPWSALEQLLCEGTKEVRAMKANCQYSDSYSERYSPSLLPLFILTVDPDQYVKPGQGFDRQAIGRATLDEDEFRTKLAPYREQLPAGSDVNPGRIAQVMLGSGYSFSHSLADGTSVLRWQFSELTNGDVLVLAGYEWHSN